MEPDSGPLEVSWITAASATLAHDARCLLDLAVEAVAKSNAHVSRSVELIRESRIARAQLKGAVTALTRELRATGEPPEKILRALRRLVNEVNDAKVERLQTDVARSFMDDVLHWSVAAYYAA